MHNDVFEMAENRVNTECSALTRAGISDLQGVSYAAVMFRPHKGGYIELYSRQFCQMEVPPSQGRVYRISPFTEESNGRSALTRAGISYIKQHQRRRQLFRPHKGGYIDSALIIWTT